MNWVAYGLVLLLPGMSLMAQVGKGEKYDNDLRKIYVLKMGMEPAFNKVDLLSSRTSRAWLDLAKTGSEVTDESLLQGLYYDHTPEGEQKDKNGESIDPRQSARKLNLLVVIGVALCKGEPFEDPTLEKCRLKILEAYVSYKSLYELATEPTGTYQNYVDNVQELKIKHKAQMTELELFLPPEPPKKDSEKAS